VIGVYIVVTAAGQCWRWCDGLWWCCKWWYSASRSQLLLLLLLTCL